MENMKKLNKIILQNKNIDYSQNCLTPFVKTQVLKLVFTIIPCLKFWALL